MPENFVAHRLAINYSLITDYPFLSSKSYAWLKAYLSNAAVFHALFFSWLGFICSFRGIYHITHDFYQLC